MSSARFRPRSDRSQPRKEITSKAADKEHIRESGRSFEEGFKQITSYVTHLKSCISESQKLFNKLKEASEAGTEGEECRGSAFMTEAEERRLEAVLSKKSTILVVGQSNSGKTCLVNELLGGSFLPTDENPCTSRIVRLKYSEQNYLKVLNKDGSVFKTISPITKKSIPKSEIALEADRSNAERVEQVVEIGIKNSLLQSGHLEIVDAPGMSENEALDKVVEECLNGILQVIIYVIDGNSPLRMQEQEFLFRLTAKMGHLPIFYVCNKVDRNNEAETYDRDSDDEDAEVAVRTIIQEKTQLSYAKLVSSGLLTDDVKLEECGVYHAVSTKEVRKARRDKKSNHYTEEFEKMKTKLLKFAKESIHSYLETATAHLCLAQRRVFDFVLSGHLTRSNSNRGETIEELKSLEMKRYEEVYQQVRESESKLAAIIKKEIENHLERILRMAQSTNAAQMLTSDVLDDTRVIVSVLVTCSAVKKGKELLEDMTSFLRTALEKSFKEVEKTKSNQLDSILLKHFLECIRLDYRVSTSDLPEELNQALLTRGVDFLTLSEDINTAEDVIRLINYDEVAKQILHVVSGKLEERHSSFTSQVRVIQNSDQESQRQSANQAIAISPAFADQMCKTEALRHLLSSGGVQLGSEIKRGHRGVVYECRDPAMSGMVAKQLTPESRQFKASGRQYLALQYAMRRIPEDCAAILKPLSLCLDCNNNVTILLPKMELNLYEALTIDRDERMRLDTILRIVLHVTNACLYSRQSGLSHVDPRITNILASLDTHGVAKLNVAKQRDDEVPYPDEMAPFHVPQPQPAELAPVESYVGHDLYSIAVLLWLLLNGEYRRPLYAGTTNVENVYSAVMRGECPDVSRCLSEMEHYNDLFALFQLSLFVWKKEKSEMLDLLNFKEKLSKLC